MQLTPYHAKYIAYLLTRRGTEGVDRLAQSLFDASVDLNPHQIEAAVFALENPLAEGVVLADEVGLGKTIEAGLVLTQLWAEGKRKLLVICPASLRKQWAIELEEKFHLPTIIIDARQYRADQKAGYQNPFDRRAVVIASISYAARKEEELLAVPWNAAVIDEAHKLRNAYRQSNRRGRKLLSTLESRWKLLLTATPLQNSVMELYGLSLFVDPHLFGDVTHFRALYSGRNAPLEDLRQRITPYFTRTLRRDVLEYVRYTERRAITQPFEPSDEEQRLYEELNAYLQREDTYAFPSQHRHLSILIIRKLLASSSHALVKTLEMIKLRLQQLLEETKAEEDPLALLLAGEDVDDDLIAEILEDEEEGDEDDHDEEDEHHEHVDRDAVQSEITLVERFIGWARSIHTDAKSLALTHALELGFAEMARMGAPQKAVVFTESRRTQEYLKRFLEANGYAGKVVTFNGPNNDPDSRAIYERWAAANADSGRSSGSRAVDTRTALIEYFRDTAQIMIATEAGAEGINLQFCSLVVNYDLPWNPQRIEQRIGRAHRYGQQYDVVVINFLNQRNDADRRVFELLAEKFQLFQGVFGASDEVLGALESGVDFESRVLDIYQTCRTPEEIQEAFDTLQRELDEQIQARMAQVRHTLLEKFDEDVHERLRVNLDRAQGLVRRTERLFWWLTQHMLADRATFDNDEYRFTLHDSPIAEAPTGTYVLSSQRQGGESGQFLYRLGHPLGQWVIELAKQVDTPAGHVRFLPSQADTRVSMAEQLAGERGVLTVDRLVVRGAEEEEYLLVSGTRGDNASVNPEAAEKLFSLPGELRDGEIAEPGLTRVQHEAERHRKAVESRSAERNSARLQEEREKLFRWAEDQEKAVEQELERTKEEIKRLNREARQAQTIDVQKSIQDKISSLDRKKRKLRQEIFQVEDEIQARRDELLDKLEARVQQDVEWERLFTVGWEVE
jgi:hypothetical protein